MRTVYLILVVLFFNTIAFASEIREFDIKTLEKLGNELTRVANNLTAARQRQSGNCRIKSRMLRRCSNVFCHVERSRDISYS